MKKAIAVLLTLLITLSCLTLAVSATAVTEKIDPAVFEHIANADDDGMVVEIHHHNDAYPTEGVSEQEAVENDRKAQHELFEQLREIGYFEIGAFSIGKINIGLPYESIEKVAALPNVDSVTMPEEGSTAPAEAKLDSVLKEKLSGMSDDSEIDLVIWLAYTDCAYIGMSEPGDDATHEEVDAYLTLMRGKRKAYTSAKNKEYTERIAAAVEGVEITPMTLTPMVFIHTTAGKVLDVAALPEVGSVYYEASTEPLDPPTEDPMTVSEKFEKWMYEKKKAVKCNDDETPHYGERSEYRNYEELYTGRGWTLIHAEFYGFFLQPWEVVASIVFGDRVLSWRAPGVEDYAYYVYDAMSDTFYPIENVCTDAYDGLLEAMSQLRIGRPVGDADGDKDLTVLDATLIQRSLAELDKLPEEDVYTEMTGTSPWYSTAYADADSDGEITVMDATRIQNRIAGR